MQIAQYVHAITGVLLTGVIIAHIYIGTIGMEGAFDAMRSGRVDLAWARYHHRPWVEEQQARTASGSQAGRGSAPATAKYRAAASGFAFPTLMGQFSPARVFARSDERRVGKDCVMTLTSEWPP